MFLFRGGRHDTESARRTGPASGTRRRAPDALDQSSCRARSPMLASRSFRGSRRRQSGCCSGGRSVIIDGNTLDPTLQLMLSGLRLAGIDGLAVDDDPAASRAQMRQTSLADSRPADSRHGRRPVDPRTRRARSRRGITARPAVRPLGPAGLLPRRRLGDRRPGHRRRAVPADVPRRRHPRVVDRLPAGSRASGAGRCRGCLCGLQVGLRARRRARRDPRAGRGRRRQRGRQPGRGRVPAGPRRAVVRRRCCSG